MLFLYDDKPSTIIHKRFIIIIKNNVMIIIKGEDNNLS